MPKLSDIMGIGPKHQAKLKKANVDTIETLLKKAATPRGVAELRSASGASPEQIRDWARRADLLRIRGIGSGYSDLLVKVGVRNVGKLAKFEPEKLHNSLARKNSALGNQVGRLPGQVEIKGWIKQARSLSASAPTGVGRVRNASFSEGTGTGGGKPGGGKPGGGG